LRLKQEYPGRDERDRQRSHPRQRFL
jgi:hypothetical protein